MRTVDKEVKDLTPRAYKQTRLHIARVRELLDDFGVKLDERGRDHDASKYSDQEAPFIEEILKLEEKEGKAPFGSEEYERRRALLGNMLKHHYAHNSHHPEHHENGVAGMTLYDLVEMYCDWVAAVERNEDNAVNLTYCVDKYKLCDMLASILKNTFELDGHKYK